MKTITAAALTITALGLAAGLRVAPACAEEAQASAPPASTATPSAPAPAPPAQASPAPASKPADSASPAPAARPVPWSQPEYRQLDFWVGEWDLTSNARGPKGEWREGKASNSVHKVLGGCVIQENFDGRPQQPYQGMSVSTYSPQLGKWQQTWVDSSGAYLDFTGEWKDGKMTFSRQATVQGQEVTQRMVFHDIQTDAFDWQWERSTDGGKTWTPMWKIHYTRKK